LEQFGRLKDVRSVHPVEMPRTKFPDPVPSRAPNSVSSDASHEEFAGKDEPPNPVVIETEVTEAINSLLDAQNVWAANQDPSSYSLSDKTLTPAQRFYLENKELLLKRMSDYSVTKAMNEYDRATKDIEDEWAFYRDPVVRPSRGKLWSVHVHDSENAAEEEVLENPDEYEASAFPSIQRIIDLLQREHVEQILALDLEAARRRDIGEYAIIGTVRSYAHGDRVGRLACRTVNKLNLENLKSFSNSTPGQEWIVVRLGSVVLHLMTTADRDKYCLEDLYAVHGGDLDEEDRSIPIEGEANSTDRLS
jgi:ribosomal silencing factor RsfS